MLTPEIVRALRAPFPAQQIKWKIQTNPRQGSEWAIVVAYVDARDVAERLDLVTGGDWSDDYAPPVITAGSQVSLLCALTVCGVTRRDVGTVARPDKDDATKDLHSDAFKRAAVKFGVAAHVYRFPNVQARVEAHTHGQRTTYRLTRAATQQLDQLTQQLLAGVPITSNAFSDLRVWGSAAGADGQPIALPQEPEEQPNVTTRATPQRTPRQNGTSGAPKHATNDTHAAAARPTNGANGHTAVLAPSPAKLSRARAALREAEQASGLANPPAMPNNSLATDKQRTCIQHLIAELRADEATVEGLATLFSTDLGIDGAALLSDPSFVLEAAMNSQVARAIIHELQALR